MSEEHWSVLTKSQEPYKAGGIIIWDYENWSSWEKWATESLGASQEWFETYFNPRYGKFRVSVSTVGARSKSIWVNLEVGSNRLLWIPLKAGWKKIQALLNSFDWNGLQEDAIDANADIHSRVGTPALHSYALTIIWEFDDYSPAVKRKFGMKVRPPPSIDGRKTYYSVIYMDALHVALPKDVGTRHPFARVYDREIVQFIKAAVKEYPPSLQPPPNSPGAPSEKWTVLNESQVEYVHCLVEKASGKDITCKRP